MRRSRGIACATLAFLAACATARGQEAAPAEPTREAQPAEAPSYYAGEGEEPTAPRVELSPVDTITESFFGDVYAPGRWRPLSYRTLFSEGWLEPWAGAPAGREGLTPRHGWLGAFDGVFYRLYLTTFSYFNDINAPFHGNRYVGDYSVFVPFSRRFEILIDAPFVLSNGTTNPHKGYASAFGDLTITPRVLLSESKATSQVFAMDIRTPTGTQAVGNRLMALAPRYEFWTNFAGPWVARGSAGFFVPLNKAQTPSQTLFNGGLAIGRYFRPHDVAFGDLVFYAATTINVPLDGGATRGTVVGIGPGTRFHIAKDFYFLNYWNFVVTGPRTSTYGVQFALLKVF